MSYDIKLRNNAVECVCMCVYDGGSDVGMMKGWFGGGGVSVFSGMASVWVRGGRKLHIT